MKQMFPNNGVIELLQCGETLAQATKHQHNVSDLLFNCTTPLDGNVTAGQFWTKGEIHIRATQAIMLPWKQQFYWE